MEGAEFCGTRGDWLTKSGRTGVTDAYNAGKMGQKYLFSRVHFPDDLGSVCQGFSGAGKEGKNTKSGYVWWA